MDQFITAISLFLSQNFKSYKRFSMITPNNTLNKVNLFSFEN